MIGELSPYFDTSFFLNNFQENVCNELYINNHEMFNFI